MSVTTLKDRMALSKAINAIKTGPCSMMEGSASYPKDDKSEAARLRMRDDYLLYVETWVIPVLESLLPKEAK